tara:strand:- start:876 stop:1247 length:372 start_codon:yes stop_codon:yes gene_type:complete
MDIQQTSREAFESVNRGDIPMSYTILDYILKCGAVGATCDEVEVYTEGLHQSVSAQIRMLAKKDLLVGKENPIEKDKLEKRHTRTGRRAIVWVTTDLVRPMVNPDTGEQGIFVIGENSRGFNN